MRRIWLGIFLTALVIIAGITGIYMTKKASGQLPFDSKTIKIKLLNKQELPQGLSFALSLKNENSLPIVQNNVFVSFPIEVQNGTTANPLKVMATGNKLNIMPNEEIQLHVFFPKESIGDRNVLDIKHPAVDVGGYIGKVNDANHFGIYAPLE